MPDNAYVTRSGQVSCPPLHLHEDAYAVIHEIYKENLYECNDDVKKEIIECTYSMEKALLFQKAMKMNPEEVMKARREEVIKAIKINIWHPVHLNDLSDKEKEINILQMINYLIKYVPDA